MLLVGDNVLQRCDVSAQLTPSRNGRGGTMNILGISAFYHDSAACLVSNGEIIAAAQEERFTRKKHDPGFHTEHSTTA